MGACRWTWNYCLDANIAEYKKTKKFIFKYDLKKQLPLLKKEREWLADVPAHALQNRVIDFESALKRVWKLGFGFPKHKSRHVEHHNTLRIDQVGEHIQIDGKKIKIPKLGWVKWVKHRPLSGELKSITIKLENNRWWVVVLCKLPDIELLEVIDENKVLGIDAGLNKFATFSSGEQIESPRFLRKSEKKIKRRQRQLARKKKKSKNREKARKKLNRAHYKVKCQRHDFTHQLSSQIAKDYDCVAVENLNIAGMKKSRLGKSISDMGWRMFVDQLDYKLASKGGLLVKIDRFAPSTKTCSSCGSIKEMPLHTRTYDCNSCDMTLDRDLNAACNIKRWGIDKVNRAGTAQIHACGDTNDGGKAIDFSSYVSLKQEAVSL